MSYLPRIMSGLVVASTVALLPACAQMQDSNDAQMQSTQTQATQTQTTQSQPAQMSDSQQSTMQSAVQAATQSSQSFSPAQLEQFAQANAEIRDIRKSAMQKMRQVQDKAKAKQISQQARESMLDAVTNAGLSVKQYNQIGRAMQSNQALANKIQSLQQ